jgi:hypothetical protein
MHDAPTIPAYINTSHVRLAEHVLIGPRFYCIAKPAHSTIASHA